MVIGSAVALRGFEGAYHLDDVILPLERNGSREMKVLSLEDKCFEGEDVKEGHWAQTSHSLCQGRWQNQMTVL